jgi:hypothetical protein
MACFLSHNISRVGSMLELQDGTKAYSQARIQNEINLHNQGKRANSANWTQVVWQIQNNLKHKLFMAHNLWEEASLPSL